MTKTRDEMGDTKRLMGALVRMKPKPHEEMMVGMKVSHKRAQKNQLQKTNSLVQALNRYRLQELNKCRYLRLMNGHPKICLSKAGHQGLTLWNMTLDNGRGGCWHGAETPFYARSIQPVRRVSDLPGRF
ncbi:formylmethanofuran dehydrogenase subunit B [Bradyrhizobium sp. cir1]|uniref:hypothetical protein n=1 Tax=Bradyrhizobium sp. cir1 TaxID=1445730 RepID=UPI001605D59D|nr:hypothetical protein [Bradyrhizobium sp. cir1]MBB4373548.1 formylmethanofuran dehydrogenase subunit B [Bradyrhizobium sp. cir1]